MQWKRSWNCDAEKWSRTCTNQLVLRRNESGWTAQGGTVEDNCSTQSRAVVPTAQSLRFGVFRYAMDAILEL